MSFRTHFLVSLLAAGGCFLNGSALAQKQLNPEDLQGLSRTDRETIHPGQPLEIVGIGQEDNDFRAASPALAEGELAVTRVDTEELRSRRLAMYKSGARYNTPPATTRRVQGIALNRTLPRFQSDRPFGDPADQEVPPEEGSTWPYWVAGVVLAGSLWIVRKRS